MIRLASITYGIYEPYTENTVTLSQPITLNGIGDVMDELTPDGVVRKVGVTDFTNATWVKNSDGKYFTNADTGIYLADSLGLCTHMVSAKNGKNCIYVNMYKSIRLNVVLDDYSVENVQSVMNGALYYGILATPITEPLPEADQIALRSLHSYDGVTHVMCDAEMAIEYDEVLGENPHVLYKKMYINGKLAYSAGNPVTYYVDSGAVYTEEVDFDASCLSPKTFTPTKSGWTFVGWREDEAASGDVLSSKVMGDAPVALYAVFKQDVAVTYYNNSTTSKAAQGTRYYNNGTVKNPTFRLSQASVDGWTIRGWSTGKDGNSAVTYNNATEFERESSVTLYGTYSKTVKLSYAGNGATSGSVASQSGTAYRNYKGDVVGASFTLKNNGFTRLDYSFSKWDLGAVGASVTLNDSKTAYAQWTQVSLTLFDGGTFYHNFDVLTEHGDDDGLNYDEGQYANWNKNSGLYMAAYAYAYKIAWITTAKIDVTNLKTLNFTISGLTCYGVATWMIGLQSERKTVADWNLGTVKHNGGYGNELTNGQTISLDVSSMTGSYYVTIQIDSGNRQTLGFTATKGWFDAK
jgi:uncharacterized repeat protein (TIGR02543 family)